MESLKGRAMAYQRKTRDEYQIHGNYGQGFEEVCAEDTRKEARERLKEYRENEPGIAFKIVVKRIKIEPRTLRAVVTRINGVTTRRVSE